MTASSVVIATGRSSSGRRIPFLTLATLTVTEVMENPYNLVINELLQDADGSGEDANQNGTANEGLDDQFVEIVNVSGFTVDISGWKLGSITSDNFGINRTTIEHVFPDGTVLNDQGSIVIFGGEGGVDGHLARMNDPDDLGPSFGNAIVQIANAGTNGLNIASDDATAFTSQLFNPYDFLMDAVKYVRADSEQGQSLTRFPDITGDFFSPDGPSLHFDVSEAFLSFSPGADILRRGLCGQWSTNPMGGTRRGGSCGLVSVGLVRILQHDVQPVALPRGTWLGLPLRGIRKR